MFDVALAAVLINGCRGGLMCRHLFEGRGVKVGTELVGRRQRRAGECSPVDVKLDWSSTIPDYALVHFGQYVARQDRRETVERLRDGFEAVNSGAGKDLPIAKGCLADMRPHVQYDMDVASSKQSRLVGERIALASLGHPSH